jgi:hypothetical protein
MDVKKMLSKWYDELPAILMDGRILVRQRLWMVALFSVWLGLGYQVSRPYSVCNLGFVKVMWVDRLPVSEKNEDGVSHE